MRTHWLVSTCVVYCSCKYRFTTDATAVLSCIVVMARQPQLAGRELNACQSSTRSYKDTAEQSEHLGGHCSLEKCQHLGKLLDRHTTAFWWCCCKIHNGG